MSRVGYVNFRPVLVNENLNQQHENRVCEFSSSLGEWTFIFFEIFNEDMGILSPSWETKI